MKNEYQEALDYIKHDLEHNDFIRYKNGNHVDKYHREVLLKLVDKEIPMKPVYRIPDISWNKNEKLAHCPTCDWRLDWEQGCHNNKCRQRIDWSDKE